MKYNKYLSGLIAGLLTISMAFSASAEITPDDFNKAMEKYLATDVGQEKLGDTIQDYFRKQQAKAQEQQAKAADVAMEEQFKNPVKVDVGNSPVKGPKDAAITIVEFSDFECPFCTRGDNTVKEVMKNYEGKVKIAFKNLPLSFHKNAEPAARAALAAGKQGKFWEMHDALFANQKSLGDAFYTKTAEGLGLDMTKFKADMASEELKNSIKADMKQAEELGISGTPGFVVNGVMVKGAYPYEHFAKIIDRQLAEKK
jgi:protein-disulfide isomerase